MGQAVLLEFLHLVTGFKYETWRTLQRAAPRLVSAPGAASFDENSAGQMAFPYWHRHGSLPHALYPPAHKLSDGRAIVRMLKGVTAGEANRLLGRTGESFCQREW